MNFNRKAILTFGLVFLSSCGHQERLSNLSYKLYDPAKFPSLLINKLDNGVIYVYIVGNENFLEEDISQAIKMWTSVSPLPQNRAVFVDDLSDADLTVEVVSPTEGRRQITTLLPYNRPVITLFTDHNRKVLLHEMGHAFGLQDTYYAYHNATTGRLESTCNIMENQPPSVMCLSQNGDYRLYDDDKLGITQLYYNRDR